MHEIHVGDKVDEIRQFERQHVLQAHDSDGPFVLVDNGQHLFWLGLGGRQESGAETCHGEDRFADVHLLTINTGSRADSGM